MIGLKKKISVNNQANRPVSDRTVTLLSSMSSIAVGLLIGFVFLFIIEIIKENPDMTNPFYGFTSLLTGGFSSVSNIISILYRAAPLLMTGLAVGFAFKAGLFNIGATGQYTVGGFFSLIAAILWQFPWWASIFVGMLAGAFWGLIPGLFKALFNINEVITTIMLNWSGLFFVNLLFYNNPDIYMSSERTKPLDVANPSAILPDLFGLRESLGFSYANIGIIIAIVIAIMIYIILEKTVFGFEIKACGQNKNASMYAGIKAKRTIIFTMLISGALAGIGGGIQFLSGTVQYTISSTRLLPMGFNGIPVALLAFSHPLGIIVTSIFISFLQVGGDAMQPAYSSEMVNVILAVIIYFSAFSLILSHFIRKKLLRKEEIIQLDEPTPPDKPVNQSALPNQDKEEANS